jgi:transposase-like protein
LVPSWDTTLVILRVQSALRIRVTSATAKVARPVRCAWTFPETVTAALRQSCPPKHERRFTGFDDKIIAMYARSMSVREIRAFLSEQYGTDVSHDFISSVTDAVPEEVSAWQQRPLEPMYPVIFFDALRVKIRDEGVVRNKAIYLALGV